MNPNPTTPKTIHQKLDTNTIQTYCSCGEKFMYLSDFEKHIAPTALEKTIRECLNELLSSVSGAPSHWEYTPELDEKIDQALAEITQIEEEAVGKDEVEDTDLSKSAKSRWGVRARNRVRAETRANLEARRG